MCTSMITEEHQFTVEVMILTVYRISKNIAGSPGHALVPT
jgi:hypothetical protein